MAVGELAEEEEAQGVQAEGVDEVEGVDDVADGLRHLLTGVEEEAVGVDAPRQLDAGAHEERGPVDAVEADDVLADDVDVGGPPLRELLVVVREAGGGDVVRQGVDPHVHHVLVVAGHRHTPVEGGAGDREVLEPGGDEGGDLVAAGVGADELGMVLVQLEQLVLVLREAEEVGLLFRPGHLGTSLLGQADAVDDLGFVIGVEGLVAHGVPARVRVEVDIAGFFELAPDGLRGGVVVLVGGADEPVEGRAEGELSVAEVLRVVVSELFGGDAEFVRRLQHLQPVLVRAGAEEDIVIVQSLEPGDRVGRNVLIGMPDVNGPVGVGNRCRQVVTHRELSLRDVAARPRMGPIPGSALLRVSSTVRKACCSPQTIQKLPGRG